MKTRFKDRAEAANCLAAVLSGYARQPNVVVLGLARGGVPVAEAIARTLHLPWDLLVVRKLGAPGREELAIGAIASGRIQILNRGVIKSLGLEPDAIARVVAREQRELARREKVFRGNRPPCPVDGRTVILVDDGIATGATVRAAIAALRQRGVGRIVVATPVVAADTLADLEREADEVVCVIAPVDFDAVGAWYDDFSQVTDQEVRDLVSASAHCQ
jgi:putative phosphoribosyl transferase